MDGGYDGEGYNFMGWLILCQHYLIEGDWEGKSKLLHTLINHDEIPTTEVTGCLVLLIDLLINTADLDEQMWILQIEFLF
jgi:hypothetical protein